MNTVSKAHLLQTFDELARQSENQKPLGKTKRAQIQGAIRRAEKAGNRTPGTMTADALSDRELLPDFALELLRLKSGSSSIIGNAKTFSEAAKKLEAFVAKYAQRPDVVEPDGTERHVSPHLETIYRTFILGVGSMEAPKETSNAGGVSGHHLFSDAEPLVELRPKVSNGVDPIHNVAITLVERDGEQFVIPSELAGNAMPLEELRSLHMDTAVRWDAVGDPVPGSTGRATSKDAPEARFYDLDVVVRVDGENRTIGTLTESIGGWGAGKGYRVQLSDAPDLRDTAMRFRTRPAHLSKLRELSTDTLDALEAEIDRLLSTTPPDSHAASVFQAVKEQIEPARTHRQERDTEREEAVNQARSSLSEFKYGPGLIAEVAMHELMELAKRMGGKSGNEA